MTYLDECLDYCGRAGYSAALVDSARAELRRLREALENRNTKSDTRVPLVGDCAHSPSLFSNSNNRLDLDQHSL